MNDHARMLFEHHRQEGTIQADSGKEIEVERAMPLLVIEHREPASGRCRAADHMDDDVNAAKALPNGISNSRTTLGRGDIRCDEQVCVTIARVLTRGGENLSATLAESRDHSFTNPFGAAGYQNAYAFKLFSHNAPLGSESQFR